MNYYYNDDDQDMDRTPEDQFYPLRMPSPVSSSSSDSDFVIIQDSMQTQEERYNDITIEERRHLIAQGLLEAGEFEGDEPWPFGLRPGETTNEARARLAREHAEIEAQNRIDPVEVIRMHQRHRENSVPLSSPSQGNDSSPYTPRTPSSAGANQMQDIEVDSDEEVYQVSPAFHAMFLHIRGIRRNLHGRPEWELERAFENARAWWVGNGMTDHEFDTAIYNTAPEPSSSDDESETQSETDARIAAERRQVLHAAYLARIAYWQQQLDAHRALEAGLRQELYDAADDLLASDPAVHARWHNHALNVHRLTNYGPRVMAMLLWFSELPERLEHATQALWQHYARQSDIDRELRMLSNRDAQNVGVPNYQPVVGNQHEYFVNLPYQGVGDNEVHTRELQWGEDVYQMNNLMVRFQGAGLFEAPDMEGEEPVMEVLAGLAVQQERARRSYPDSRAWEHYINRRSVRYWVVGANLWANENEQWLLTSSDWDIFHDALDAMMDVLDSGEDQRIWDVHVNNMAAQGIDVYQLAEALLDAVDHGDSDVSDPYYGEGSTRVSNTDAQDDDVDQQDEEMYSISNMPEDYDYPEDDDDLYG